MMMMSESAWIIRYFNLERNKYLFCGGVCIHSSGILLSVALPGMVVNSRLSGKCGWMKSFVKLKVATVDTRRNIAMLYVDPPALGPTYLYQSVTLSANKQTFSGQEIHSFVMTSLCSEQKYSWVSGCVQFPSGIDPSPWNDLHPEIEERFNVDRRFGNLKIAWDDEMEERRLAIAKGEYRYNNRFEGFMYDSDDNGSIMCEVDPDLPLIQIEGFPSWYPGVYGFPVFDSLQQLIGLIAFCHSDATYALTISTLVEFLKEDHLVGEMKVSFDENEVVL